MKINNLEEVHCLIAQKEGDKIEFKQTTGQLEPAMQTLCGFLNGEGGSVLFGVTDDGNVVGQEVSDDTKRKIGNAIQLFYPYCPVTISGSSGICVGKVTMRNYKQK